MARDDVLVERDGPVTTVIINRPEARNACRVETVKALHDAFMEFEADDGARVAVLAGQGGSFCAGADLKELASGAALGFCWAGEDKGVTRRSLAKPVIAAVEGHAVAAGLALAVWCALGTLQVWHLAVGALVNGFGWLTDNPLRRTMMGDSVGRERMSTAMALDVVAQNGSRMIGPTLGGVVLVAGGIEGAFLLCAGLYLLAVGATLAVRGHLPPATHVEPVLARVREGIATVLANRRLAAILAVTIVFNIFGWPFTSMIPVIGRDQLALGPEGVGLLTSIDGVGAFAGALVLAWRLAPRFHAASYVGGVALYQAGIIAFALAPGVVPASAALLLTGLAGGAFATLQATLVYLAAPIEMRSRIMGVLSVCIGTGPLGFLWLGWLANRIGAPEATAVTGALGLALLLALRPLWRTI